MTRCTKNKSWQSHGLFFCIRRTRKGGKEKCPVDTFPDAARRVPPGAPMIKRKRAR